MRSFRNSLSYRSLSILSSCLLFVGIATVLELPIISSFIPMAVRRSILGGVGIVGLAIFKIYFYSGMYGVLLEIVSGEEIVFSYRKFNANAKRFWKIYVLVAFLPFVTYFLLFALWPQGKMTLSSVTSYGDILFNGLLVYLLVLQKYLKEFNLPQRSASLPTEDALFLLFLLLANISVYNLPLFFDLPPFRFERLSVVFFQYSHILVFLCLAHIVLGRYPEIRERFTFGSELYLINPSGGGALWFLASFFLRNHPPWFVVLAALTPERYHIRKFNRIFWHQRYFASGKLIAISCYSTNSVEAYKIAKEFKKRGSTVIMGGPHVMFVPDEALEFCDSVVVGEAEGVWPQVIMDYENQCLKKKYFPRDDETAFQKVHQFLLNSPPEIIKDFLETTRGCKFHCYFCAIPNLGRTCLRKKPVSEIVELIQKIQPKYQLINFLDNNIYSDPAYAKELFLAIKPLRIKWSASSSIDIAQNEELLSLAKASGCRMLLFGYEISAESQEQSQGGKFAMAKKYLELTRKVQKKGISIKAHVIAGFDADNLRSLWKLWVFCLRVNPLQTGLSILTPLPGSLFFNDALMQNRILNLNWRNYAAQHPVFRFKQLPLGFFSQYFYSVFLFFFVLLSSSSGRIIFIIYVVILYFSLR